MYKTLNIPFLKSILVKMIPKLLLIVVCVAVSFLLGYVIGGVRGMNQAHAKNYQREGALVLPIIQSDSAYRHLIYSLGSDGTIILIGEVSSNTDRVRLHQELKTAVGQPRADE